MKTFDLIVVGAGHAGCEAAAAAARLGRRVALVTLDLAHVARLSCNPAVGGLAKGHLVRELDALGGLMGRVADASSIQFRRLNTRKGLAVQSSRCQVDIAQYPRAMQAQLAPLETLTRIAGEVAAIRMNKGRVAGVQLGDDTVLEAPAVVLTTGTFLAGVLHCGGEKTVGGRIGDGAAHRLSGSLASLGLRLGRLKTGTVPRLDARTIAWDRVPVQEDLVPEGRFSFRADPLPKLRQIDCHLTYTNEVVHEAIRSGLDRSPLFTGQISGRGPRYCPSIEDKVVRFPDRDRHLLFLEPEGLETDRVYVNGLSTSLPSDIQDEMLRNIVGLEEARILQYGYAVEYDYADPTDLGHDLQHRGIPGLYLAGQVNGTSGYEEAAVQGFVAGLSAALGEPFVLGRSEAYIGVLIDDLVSKGVGGEPYRMFTSRAEHRLLLREDNADRRLMEKGRSLGLIDDTTWEAFSARQVALEECQKALQHQVVPTAENRRRVEESGLGPLKKPTTLEGLLRRPGCTWRQLSEAFDLPEVTDAVAEQLEIDTKYAGYVDRAARRARRADKLDTLRIPADVDWKTMQALSWEVRERLIDARPQTLGQLARLPGVTPAAVNVVAAYLQADQTRRSRTERR